MIISNSNSKIKLLRNLHLKKNRYKYKKYLVEGYQISLDYLKYSNSIDYALVSEEFDKLEDIKKIKQDLKIHIVDKDIFNKSSDTKNSQGIILIVNFENYKIDEIMEKKNIILIDGIQDPGNLGTIIRTCDAFNVGGVITLENTVDLYNNKAVRASMGSITRLPVVVCVSNAEILEKLKISGFKIFSSTPRYNIDIKTLDFKEKIALVIGNEGSGVSEKILCESDDFVGIKMKGDIESLNAGIAAGILIYEITN
ncbi:MAG: RNA methyltransferase [Eubacteriales bacterium]